MGRKNVVEIAKFVSALAVGVVLGAISQPAVKNFFKLNKNETVDVVPSEDITDDDVAEECCDE